MKEEIVRVTFYKISECGFYRYGRKTPEFGSIIEILTDLQKWSNGKRSQDTCTYESFPKTYCCDIATNSTGDFLLVTWNESPFKGDGMLSMDGKKLVGEIEVQSSKIPSGGIPGYPTYFWFIPDRNIVATIQIGAYGEFERQPNGALHLRKYLENFLSFFSPQFVEVKKDGDGDGVVHIYKRPNGEEVIGTIYPKFDIKLYRTPSSTKAIFDKKDSIIKIRRKSFLHLKNQDDLTFSQKLFLKMGIVNIPDTYDNLKIRYDVSCTPDEATLKEIIEKWEASEHNDKFDDVGFVFSGEGSKTTWLGSSIIRDEIQVSLKDNVHYYDAEALLKSLITQKDRLLRILDKSL